MSCVDYLWNKISDFYNNMFYNMCREEKTRNWNPCDIFSQYSDANKHIVMILNRPLPSDFKQNFIISLWQNALLRITVDGGTNSWFSWLKLNNYDQNKVVVPDVITGDMDSLSKEVLQFFIKRNRNIRVIKTPDQNETDFTKAVREVQGCIKSENLGVDTIIVFADTSGRFDQILANINTLFKARHILPDINILMLASDSLTWLLTEGVVHKIDIPLKLRNSREWCALIPIGASCRVTTTGLKWNLNNSLMEFGNMVSTSNTYSGDSCVTVQTDQPLVWSMGIQSLL